MKHLMLFESFSLLNESISSAKRRFVDTGKISEDNFYNYLKMDFSKSKKYVEKMIEFEVEAERNVDFAIPWFRDFDELSQKGVLKQNGEKTNIQDYSYEELRALSLKYKDRPLSKREQVKIIKDEGTEKVFENDKCLIYILKTQEASMIYCEDTAWCTASKTGTMFEKYSKLGPLYVIIDKNNKNEKYQMHIPTRSFKDIDDKSVSCNKLTELLERLEAKEIIESVIRKYLKNLNETPLDTSKPLDLMYDGYLVLDGDKLIWDVNEDLNDIFVDETVNPFDNFDIEDRSDVKYVSDLEVGEDKKSSIK